MNILFSMAFRNIGRNKRRSILSAVALSVGVMLLLLMVGFLNGEMNSTQETTIRLQSGHLQVRAQNYNENKTSLKWEDLIEDPYTKAQQIASLSPVLAATPRLYLSGILAVQEQTAGVRIYGLDPSSPASEPYSSGIVAGTNITPDDKNAILMGRPLAERLKLNVGDTIQLSVNTSNGDVAEQNFEVRGIYTTNVIGFDKSTIIMPLAKAQAMGKAENHASLIFVLLKDRNDTDAVIASIQGGGYQILGWSEMNEFMMVMEEMAGQYFMIFYIIVLSITASVITNTQLMAVFERTREIGVLTSMGMKARRILALFMLEAGYLAVAGTFIGIVLGILVNQLFGMVGFTFGDFGLTDVLMPNTIYPQINFVNIVEISIYSLVITMLASIYPAFVAARMEPVEALHSSL
jgi:ABC-type lipoprotein release transport system permease subunit